MRRRVISRTIDGAPIYNRPPINWPAIRQRALVFVETAYYYASITALVVLTGCFLYSILTRPVQ